MSVNSTYFEKEFLCIVKDDCEDEDPALNRERLPDWVECITVDLRNCTPFTKAGVHDEFGEMTDIHIGGGSFIKLAFLMKILSSDERLSLPTPATTTTSD